jgi:thymidylate synthase
MKTFNVRNVHQALPAVLAHLLSENVRTESRNGPVLRFSGPVATRYLRPEERVMFWAERDCNPFFHLYESLWMLAGRNDLTPLTYFVPRMADFSDDGQTLHGAYGYRWRRWFNGKDQLEQIITALRNDPTDRRQVLSMWDAREDLGRQGKDLPCNLQALFCVNEFNRLDMMVTNRSNDIVLGAYGANAVHFSYLHEYLSRRIGIGQGSYWQVSMNFHAYVNPQLEKVAEMVARLSEVDAGRTRDLFDPYEAGEVEPYPLMNAATSPEDWAQDLYRFLSVTVPEIMDKSLAWSDPFFAEVAMPMLRTFYAYKSNPAGRKFERAQACTFDILASDWRRAAQEWIERRRVAYERANDDGAQSAAAE